jgi:hypothetical protein
MTPPRQLLLLVFCCALPPTAVAADYTYTYSPGAIGAGNDVIPPVMMAPGAAKTKCSSLPRCVGITYHGSNTTTSPQKVYFKSSAGRSSDPTWTTYLKHGEVFPPALVRSVGGTSQLTLSLRKDYGTVQALNSTKIGQPPTGYGVQPTSYSFARPLDQASCLPLCTHLGDISLRLQDASATDPLDSVFYSSTLLAAPAKPLTPSSGGRTLAAHDITDMLAASAAPPPDGSHHHSPATSAAAAAAAAAASFPLRVTREYARSADDAALILSFNLSNNSPDAVRLVGLGFAMPESPGHPPSGIQETVWNDPHIGGDHGFVE